MTLKEGKNDKQFIWETRHVLHQYMQLHVPSCHLPLRNSQTLALSEEGTVWGGVFIAKQMSLKRTYPKKIWSSVWLEQAVFYKYSWLPLQHVLSTKMQQLRQKAPPAQPRMCSGGHRHGAIHAECSSRTLPGQSQWQGLSCGRVFLPVSPRRQAFLSPLPCLQFQHGPAPGQHPAAAAPRPRLSQAGRAHTSVSCAFVSGISALLLVG